MQIRVFVLLIVLTLAAACGPVPATPTPDLVSTVVVGTLTAAAVHADPATATAAPTTEATGTAEPYAAHFVYTAAQNVNLRTKPGRLFPVSRVMAQGTSLQVLGRAPGGDWLNVITDESIIGWVQVNFVNGGFDGPPPPIIEPQDVQLVSGRVTNEAGQPVNGIGFAVTQGSASNAPRTDATTDETGTFYAYLPVSTSGLWYVGYTGIACYSSLMGSDCKCLAGVCGEPQPASLPVTLPAQGVLTFVWK